MDKIVIIEDDPGIRTGLGLAIVKHIAQLHGGEVIVQSKPDAGATFTLTI